MRILDRLVVGSFLKLFMAFVVGAPLLFVLADATENLDRYLDRGIAFGDVVWAYVYQLPQFVVWAFPIAALLATVFTVHSMTVNREIVAAKAGGISFHRIVAPLLVLGVVLTGLALGISDLAPGFTRTATDILEGERTSRQWRNNFVFQTDSGYVLTIRRLTLEDGRMQGIAAERIPDRDNAALRVHMVAEEGTYEPDRGWTFHQGYYRHLAPGNGAERAFAFDSLRVRDLVEPPESLMEEPRDEDEMTYRELGELAEAVYRSGGDPNRLLVKRAQKLAIPVATLVIILFGAPLATSAKRGGAAFGVGVSLGTTILYLLLFRVAGAFGQSGAMDPALAAWVPNLIFLAAGLVLMARVRT